MFRQLKNFLLHDVPPNEGEFLASPRIYLRKLLLDDDNNHHHRPFTGYTSCYPTPHVSTTSLSKRNSFELPVDVVDDGHALGLGNPKILYSILRHLPSADLLQCRLVNLRWNVVSSSILHKKLPYTKVPPSKLKSFIKLMTSSVVANPIGSYAIRIDQINEKNTYKFLHLFCQQIINLRVRLNITELVEFAKHLQNMRNLKRLHIIIFEDGTRTNNHFIWNSSFPNINVCDENGAWKMGLYSFPSVCRLYLENANPSYKIAPFYDRIASNIIVACGNLQGLQLISWNSPLGRIFTKFDACQKPGYLDLIGKCARAEEIENLFFNTNLQFDSLRLEVNTQVKFELVTDVIHRCGDKLYELTVSNVDIFEKFHISSVLRSLVKLRLNLWSGPVDFTYFSRQYPALRSVSLHLSNLFQVDQAHWNELGEGKIIEPCKTVKTLTMTRLETGVDAGLIEKLAVLFPNLRQFFVEVKNGKPVEKIYAVFPELTLLSVEFNCNYGGDDDESEGGDMTNKCFTGVPENEIKIIQEMECGCPKVEFLEESRSCWNIACLKNLTTLLIRVPNTVNNIALLEGISRLENLQNLVLLPFYNEMEEPTKWCLRSIADNFPKLRTLVTSSEVEYSPSDVQYLLDSIPGLLHRKKE